MDVFHECYNEVYTEEQRLAISDEFSRLKGQYYLEHAGATLYSERQIRNISKQLCDNLYANPHARNASSKSTEDAIDIVRYQVLKHFKTCPEEYSVIFTSGATSSLKLVGESFNYNNGTFVYLQDNHTSVLGMREYARNAKCLKLEKVSRIFAQNNNNCKLMHNDINNAKNKNETNSLFVYPAQSNFSGTKYPLNWIKRIKNGLLNNEFPSSENWFVLLDAAAFLGCNQLDLSVFKPDFVAFSFYKIFGYPSGLGALLVRNSSAHLLHKRYFGGGTVLMALSLQQVHVPRKVLHEHFEDGTLPFLSILSVKEGFNTLNRLDLSFDSISRHTFMLARYVYRKLLCLHHSNGQPLAILYHNNFDNPNDQGGIVNFNLLRDNGDYVGYSEVLNFANLFGIHLRTGCFCNPGACQFHLQLQCEDVKRHFEAGHVCGDQFDLIDGFPTGSVRISFGYMSRKEDADRFLEMVNAFVVAPSIMKIPSGCANRSAENHENFTALLNNKVERSKGTLQEIILYPLKSCGGFSANKWPLTSTGLKYDREWMIVNSMGVAVTQKNNRNLCRIRPEIDLSRKLLILSYPGHGEVTTALDVTPRYQKSAFLCQSKVCGDRIQGWDCGDEVADWLSAILETPGLRLLKQCRPESEEIIGRTTKNNEHTQLSLANKAQYLLVNIASVDWIRDKIPPNQDLHEDVSATIMRFRPNFVVKLERAFEEDDYDEFIFDGIKFKAGGKCTRCQMICIDQRTGNFSKEPLQTLSKEFKGKISFGIYLNRNCNEEASLAVGSDILACPHLNK